MDSATNMSIYNAHTNLITKVQGSDLLQSMCNCVHNGTKASMKLQFQVVNVKLLQFHYRTRAIISRGLYIILHTFSDHFFVFNRKEAFWENSVLMYD